MAPVPSWQDQATKHRRTLRGERLKKVKTAVQDAAKRGYKNKTLVEPCDLFVGNVGPEVDEKALRNHFGSCGKILTVQIHCCGGMALTVNPIPASYYQNMKVRQYAIMTFGSKLARRKACKLEGILAGRQLKACIRVSDLPEVQEKITKRLEEYQLRQEPPDAHRAQHSALNSLKMVPTELIDARCDNDRRKRLHVKGYGLYESIN